MSDTGTPNATPLTDEEIAELGGRLDEDTGATTGLGDDGFDFSTSNADGGLDGADDDDGFGLDDFTEGANDLLDVAGKAVDTVSEVADILDPPADTPPERRRSSGTRNVSNEVEADDAPAEEEDAPPSVIGPPEWLAFDTAGNVYVLGFVVPWWGVILGLGAAYIVYEVIVFLFFSKKSKKKSWFF